MSRVVHVEVTAEDIAAGKRNKACDCPVARALQRARPDYPGRLGVFRMGMMFAAGTYDTLKDVPLPRDVSDWVHRFDDGLPVKPFAFDLELP